MKFAQLIAIIASAAAYAMPENMGRNARSVSATPKNPTHVGRAGRMTVAQNRRMAKKARGVSRNRLAHR